MKLVHATCVKMGDVGIMLRGASGSGKSDLALRLINRGARLIGDDYVYVGCEDGRLYAAAPHEISGKIEVRGVGIAVVPFDRVARIAAVIDLQNERVERLPQQSETMIETVALPCFKLMPFEDSACEKVALLVAALASVDFSRALSIEG